MKRNLIIYFVFLVAFAIGSTIGNVISRIIWPQQHHICECEYCKTVRQREAVEVIDNIIHERIVINIDKED